MLEKRLAGPVRSAGLILVVAGTHTLASCGGADDGPHAAESGAAEAEVAYEAVGSSEPVSPPPGIEVPEGMVYVPGGLTEIGAEDGLTEEQPVFRAEVDAFFMDVHPVTVAQFREFVESTDHVTEAETFGDAAVLDLATGHWELVAGAYWQHPQGPAGPPASDDHPVTQVSWNDAVAYAEWAGKRLPTEVEWEHAARGGQNGRSPYAWGDQLSNGPVHHANTWQPEVADDDAAGDGHAFTSPIGVYGETSLGLTDMGGNVWEWTADWYRPYAERDQPYSPGPQSEKAQRGGSFLCHEDFCHGYRVSARSHSTPETSLFHTGFRLVRDVPTEATGDRN